MRIGNQVEIIRWSNRLCSNFPFLWYIPR